MKTKNETAVKFQNWLAEEVIPSISRTGALMNTKYDQVRAMSVYSRKLETSSIGKFVRYCKDTKYPVKKTALYTELSTMVNSLAKVSDIRKNILSIPVLKEKDNIVLLFFTSCIGLLRRLVIS